MNDQPIVTYIIILVTAVMTWRGFYKRGVEAQFLFNSQRIKDQREYYRMITSGFLHGDWMHFAFNMITLYWWGPTIEKGVGPLHFLLVYFGSILGGSALAYYIHKNHHYLALGASGGVCGILFATIFLVPGSHVGLIFLPIFIPAWLFMILFLLYTVFGMRAQGSRIGHDAHLGGAITGLAIITILKPSIISEQTMLFAFFAVFTGGMCWYLVKNPMMLPMKNFGLKNPFSKRDKRSEMELYDAFELDAREAESDAEKLDRLLAKVSDVGFDKLTAIEKVQLKQLSARMAERDDRRRDRRNKRERGE